MQMKLPILSGIELIKFLEQNGFSTTRQKGSHIVLVKHTLTGKITTVVPIHKSIDPGTLKGILNQAKLTREELINYFK